MFDHTKEDVSRVIEYAKAPGIKPVTAEMAHMLANLLERIEADESAVTDKVVDTAMAAFRKRAYASDGMRSALLAVWPNPPAQAAEVDGFFDGLDKSVAHEIDEDSGFWKPCTGCYETEDGHPVGKYPHSQIFRCAVGGGCAECGGIGVVWDDTDYDALVRESAAEPVAQPSPDAADSGRVVLDAEVVAKWFGQIEHELTAKTLSERNGDQSWKFELRAFVRKCQAALAAQGQGEMERTVADDMRDFGNGFSVDGKRVDPSRVVIYPAASPAGVPDGERSDVWVVQDENGQPIHCASWPLACHEHINDAINEHGIEEAKAWKVLHYSSSATIPSAPAKHCDRGPDDCVQCSVLAGTFAVKSAAPSAPEGGEVGL